VVETSIVTCIEVDGHGRAHTHTLSEKHYLTNLEN